MPKGTYPVEYGKRTWQELENIERIGYDMPEIFTDFVNFVLNALLSLTDNMKYADFQEKLADNRLTGMYEDRYMEIVRKYKENQSRPHGKRPADYFAQAWRWLQVETAHSQKDVLGQLYESQITLGRQGQFFTPHHLFQALADMLSTEETALSFMGKVTSDMSESKRERKPRVENVHDPACGSGRAFITMAQQNLDKQQYFVGIDVSPVMARIAAINMWLFDLNAEIWQGNTLSMELSYVWQIHKGGWIWESKVVGENGQVDGTVAAWLEEYNKNHPPLPEEQRQAILADYERWQKILSVMREMETQFQSQSQSAEEQPGEVQGGTSTEEPVQKESQTLEVPPMVVVSEGYQRLDNYQSPDEEDSTFTVAFVLPNEETVETIYQACLQYLPLSAHKGGIEINGFPALLTTEEYASQIEEALIAARGSVEPIGKPSGIAIETWVLGDSMNTPPIAPVDTGQTTLFADMPPVKEKQTQPKKPAKQQTNPQQQSLFDL